jgi:hypothetical protein
LQAMVCIPGQISPLMIPLSSRNMSGITHSQPSLIHSISLLQGRLN